MIPEVYWTTSGRTYSAKDNSIIHSIEEEYILIHLCGYTLNNGDFDKIFFIEKVSGNKKLPYRVQCWQLNLGGALAPSTIFEGKESYYTPSFQGFELLKERFPNDFLALTFYPSVFSGKFRIKGE